MPDITCNLCGGADFYYDSGFYYCSDCQTQTQDIQEHVFEQPEEFTNTKKTRKVKKKTDEGKAVDRITTWECYNYIILGLVNELAELGASSNLKSTVEVLWFKYLKSIDVVGRGNAPPKLPAFNSKVDAEIIYGRKIIKNKRRRSATSSPSSNADVTMLDNLALKKERIKHKKALAKAEFTDFLSTTQQSSASVPIIQSLSELKSSSELLVKDSTKFLHYQKSAAKELKQKMTKTHFKNHCRDVNSALTCHKPSVRTVSNKYIASPVVLSRSKVFSIIHLGLLINKEEIQLGDMLRYIREGFLSYEHYNHFFPEEIIEKDLNICSFSHGNQPLLSSGLRTCSAKMAKFLNVNKYIPVQNLVELCKRYCEELHLPDELYNLVLKLLARSCPKMSVYNQPNDIPNYEARAMSFIIFVLKLQFCLDDATEFEFSNLADTVNNIFGNSTFNFKRWLEHIEYRKLILAKYHFPTRYLNDNHDNPDNFIGFLTKIQEKSGEDDEFPLEVELLKDVLETIKDSSSYVPVKFDFSHSLIPYRDYTKQLLASNSFVDNKDHFIDLLSADYSILSLDFLNHIESYKKLLLPEFELVYKHGGKNDNIKVTNLYDRENERFKALRVEKKTVKVTFTDTGEENKIRTHDKPAVKKFKEDPEMFLKTFEIQNVKKHKENKLKSARTLRNFDVKIAAEDLQDIRVDECIYNPAERFWLNLQNISDFAVEELKKFLEDLPLSFRMVLRECARIIEQTEKDLYMEYCIVEVYLCYVFNVKTRKFCDKKVIDDEVRKLLEKAKKIW